MQHLNGLAVLGWSLTRCAAGRFFCLSARGLLIDQKMRGSFLQLIN
jgi:hypothetical protein